MKERLNALDGLRGLAALSVFLAHTGFNTSVVAAIPVFSVVFSIFSDGTNAVQILFVLSGFLMAYLYQDLTSATGFIRKRYTRIFPLYIVIVLYLWIVNLQYTGILWYQQLFVLFAVALSFHFVWRFIRKNDPSGKWRTAVFFGFIAIQLIAIVVNFFALARYTSFGQVSFPNQLVTFSNLTLTTNFIKNMPRLSSVFWSLVPEVLFYIFFPFLVVPLIKVSKKWGPIVSLFIILGMTKIVFDLDVAFYSYTGFQSMNIARACGFIAGVVMGTLYKSQGKIWNKLSSLFTSSFLGVIIFTCFLWTQWAVGQALENGQGEGTLNFYYLLSSWVIALLIVAVIVPKTIMNRIFSHKIMIFLGLISYSVYLVHSSLIDVSNKIIFSLKPFITSAALSSIMSLLIALFLTIGISYLLFRLVESIYFADKNLKVKKPTTDENTILQPDKTVHTVRNVWVGGFIFSILIIVIYAGSYSSALTVSRHSFKNSTVPTDKEVSLLGQNVSIPFIASDNNLSEVVILMRYVKSAGYTREKIKHPAQLIFKLYDENKKPLFQSQRDALEIEGELRFPFAFTTQQYAKDKKYTVVLSLQNGSPLDYDLINTSSTSFVSIYTNPNMSKVTILKKNLINRFFFALSNPDAQFALLFLVLILFLQVINPSKLRTKSTNT